MDVNKTNIPNKPAYVYRVWYSNGMPESIECTVQASAALDNGCIEDHQMLAGIIREQLDLLCISVRHFTLDR